MDKLKAIPQKIQRRLVVTSRRWRDNLQIARKAREIAAHVPEPRDIRPVIFFKASTGTRDFTLNNAFHILAAWGLRLQGVPVIHFACERGMKPCVLGTFRKKPTSPPPCRSCIAHSRALFAGAETHWFGYQPDLTLESLIKPLSLAELMAYELNHAVAGIPSPIPLGTLVAPGLRWILRRYHLFDDEPTRYLYRRYIISAWSVAQEFNSLLAQTNPQMVVVFNGQFYPEAVIRWISQRRGVRSITHEVAFQPFSVFFTEGEATASPIHVPEDFDMNAKREARLDEYLENRFHGKFNMAGIRFWPEMKGLGEELLKKTAQFQQIVPVFTNVIFDTSQPHANTVFSDMFAWLELVVQLARAHTETLFIIRAHPDENRPGKESLETVEDWLNRHSMIGLPNLIFIPPTQYISSYELIQQSKFVMVYNSTIGLEAAIMGAAVLCGGKARYTPYKTVFFPQTEAEYQQLAEKFLGENKISIPDEFQKNARRFLYYQLFRIPLLMDDFLTTNVSPSLTRFKDFKWEQLLPQKSPTIASILEGVLYNGDFTLHE